MATKNFMTLENLTTYDGLIKQYIGTEDAKSLKSITVVGNTVSFFKTADASGTPAYTVNIPDVSGFMSKLTSATGGKIVTSLASGEVSESATAISDLATNAFVGTIPSGATSTTVTGYAKEVADSKDAAISAAQDAADAAQTAADAAQTAADTAQGEVDTLETYVGTIPSTATATSVVGYIDEAADAVSDEVDALDQSLAAVAKSGDAEDVSYDNTDSGLTATDVQAAIDELAEASAGGVASKTVYMVASGSTTDYAQVYDVYQGANGSSASPVPAEKIGTINIPKDKVVESGSVETVTTPDVPYPGAKVGDKYIELVLQNVADPLYIPANSLVDVYTGGTTTEATVTIDNSNEITVTIGEINGSKLTAASVAKGKLASGVQDSLDLADSAVQSVAEGTTNGTIAVDGTDVAVHGLGSAAYANTTAFDAAGAASTAEQNAKDYADGLASNYDPAGAASTAKSEVIGTSSDAASASTIYGAKAYADASTAAIATADIQNLFN